MENLKPSCTVGGNTTGATAIENSGQFFKKVRMELPYDPAILHRRTEKRYSNRYTYAIFIAALITVAERWEQPESMSRCMDEEGAV